MLDFLGKKEEKGKEENMARSLKEGKRKEKKMDVGCKSHKESSTIIINK